MSSSELVTSTLTPKVSAHPHAAKDYAAFFEGALARLDTAQGNLEIEGVIQA